MYMYFDNTARTYIILWYSVKSNIRLLYIVYTLYTQVRTCVCVCVCVQLQCVKTLND